MGYNMMTIESVRNQLINKNSNYSKDEIEKFLSKLNRVKKNNESESIAYREYGNRFIEDIVYEDFSDIENADKMICDILLSALVEKKYYLMSDGFDDAKEFLKQQNSLIKLLKEVIEEIYVIVNPEWEEYRQFIECSLKIIKYLSLDELVQLKNETKSVMETNYYNALMSRLIYGMEYAGESGDFGKNFQGIKQIEKYSGQIENELIEEILRYISFEDNSLIRKNPKSIFTLINNSKLDDIMRKRDKFFYIDSSFIAWKMEKIAYKEISASEKFSNYTHEELKNNGIVTTKNVRKRTILKKVNNKPSNGNEIEFYEDMNIEDKTIEYTIKEDSISTFIIKFSYLSEEGKDFIEVDAKNNLHNLISNKMEYNYRKLDSYIFHECKIDENFMNVTEYLRKIIMGFINTQKIVRENLEILYLYVDNMHGDSDKQHSIALSNKYKFKLNSKKEIHIETNSNKCKLEKFFNIQEHDNGINSINALIGKNGCGKTSVLKLIKESKLFGGDCEFDNETKYCLVTQIGSSIYWISNNDEIKVISDSDEIILKEIDPSSDQYENMMDTNVIFFSNIVNLNDKNFLKSNNRKLKDISSQYVYTHELNSKFDFKYNNDVIRIIEFTLKYKDMIEKHEEELAKIQPRYDKNVLDIKILDYINLEVLSRDYIVDYLIGKLSNCEDDKLKNENIKSLLLSVDLEMNNKIDMFLKDKKCKDNINDAKNGDKIKEIITTFISNYYYIKKYVCLIKNNKFNISSTDKIWEVADLLISVSCLDDNFTVGSNILKINFSNLKDVLIEMEKIISSNELNGLNYVIYNINNISSGEMARLTLFSRLDWIWNKQKVTTEIKEMIWFDVRNYVLILDEVEAFFHPDWQRTFIYDLILFLEFEKKYNNTFDNMQIIISSNSPFFISDLPKGKINFLGVDKNAMGGFGQNIYTIMKDGFFIKEGLMGEFAKTKINKILDELINESSECLNNKKNQIKEVINLVEEPLIKKKLLMIYNEKFENTYKKIIELTQEIQELEFSANDYNYDKIRKLRLELSRLTSVGDEK